MNTSLSNLYYVKTMSALKVPSNLQPILKPIYKRTYDGYYIMTNIVEIAHIFRWRSLDGFIQYLEEQYGAKIQYMNGTYLLESDISVSAFNNFLIREHFKTTTSIAAGII